jgi:hypothetical protein
MRQEQDGWNKNNKPSAQNSLGPLFGSDEGSTAVSEHGARIGRNPAFHATE